MPEGEVLFELDSVGVEFYIILKGEVDVFIYLPSKEEDTHDKISILDLPNSLEKCSSKTKKRFKSSFGYKRPKTNLFQYTTVVKKKENTYLFHRSSLLTKVNSLKEGASFGEAALTSNRPSLRNATIFTKTDCYFAVLDKDSFRRIISQSVNLEVIGRLDLVRSISMFEVLPDVTLQTLVYSMVNERYHMRNVIVQQGKPVDSLFIVANGSVSISIKTGNPLPGSHCCSTIKKVKHGD